MGNIWFVFIRGNHDNPAYFDGHTAPSFCELQNKSGLSQWAVGDECLLDDVQDERKVFDSIYETLKSGNQPLKRWYYGHFHQSWYSFIDGVLFKMLDIMELSEPPYVDANVAI